MAKLLAVVHAATAAFCWHLRGSWNLTGRHYRLHNCLQSLQRSSSMLAGSATTQKWAMPEGLPSGPPTVSRTVG